MGDTVTENPHPDGDYPPIWTDTRDDTDTN